MVSERAADVLAGVDHLIRLGFAGGVAAIIAEAGSFQDLSELPGLGFGQRDRDLDGVHVHDRLLVRCGPDPDSAATVLDDPLALTVFDAAHSQNEERWFTLGLSSEGTLLAVAHTYQSTDAGLEQVRIISARAATRRERQQYENEPR